MRRMPIILALILFATVMHSEDKGPSSNAKQFAFFSETTRWVFKSPFWAGVGVAAVSTDALALSMMNQCQGLADCPVIVEICEPVILSKQTDSKTSIERGNWKATYKGNLRGKTF